MLGCGSRHPHRCRERRCRLLRLKDRPRTPIGRHGATRMSGGGEQKGSAEAPAERHPGLAAEMLRIGASLDLETVLHEVTHGARELTAARYDCIATIDQSGAHPHFVTSGLTDEEPGQTCFLVVDDDPEFVGDALADVDYAPLATDDPRNIARLIHTRRPHLVPLDLDIARGGRNRADVAHPGVRRRAGHRHLRLRPR